MKFRKAIFMNKQKSSPLITHLAWGVLEVDGKKRYKDAKLYPGGSRAWDWNETGTRHVPGIQPADVEELLQYDVQSIVLSKGVHEVLQVCPETLVYLEEKGITTYVLQTEAAVEMYNSLAEKERVAGLFHSTC